MSLHDRIRNWDKASRTHYEENACVEVGSTGTSFALRDTKDRDLDTTDRPLIVTSKATGAEFLRTVRAETP